VPYGTPGRVFLLIGALARLLRAHTSHPLLFAIEMRYLCAHYAWGELVSPSAGREGVSPSRPHITELTDNQSSFAAFAQRSSAPTASLRLGAKDYGENTAMYVAGSPI
jgi:hypothetical protein